MPEILTPADRAELEQLNEDNLPDRAEVRRPPLSGAGVARQDGGTRVLTPQLVYLDELCRVGPMLPATAIVADQKVAGGVRTVAFTKGRDVVARDELTITLSTGEVLQLDVVGVAQPHAYEVARIVTCKPRGSA